MSKLRSVSTAFWSDPFIEDLTPSEKLLFLYLITNDKTNMLGIYEVSIKKISFDTGLNKDIIEKSLKEFERLSKVKYVKNHIVLVNFMKHQNYNTNMKKSAIDIYNELPNELKDSKLTLTKDNPIKGFESLLNHYGMVSKYEVEDETETEDETEDELQDKKKRFVPPSQIEVVDYFNQNGYSNESAIKAFKYYETGNWKDGKGNQVKNWKQKMQSVWFKEDNKIKPVNKGYDYNNVRGKLS